MKYQPQTGLNSVPQKDKAKKESFATTMQKTSFPSPNKTDLCNGKIKSPKPTATWTHYFKRQLKREPQLQPQASLNKKLKVTTVFCIYTNITQTLCLERGYRPPAEDAVFKVVLE